MKNNTKVVASYLSAVTIINCLAYDMIIKGKTLDDILIIQSFVFNNHIISQTVIHVVFIAISIIYL